jgi:hypothetical protein
MQLKEKIWIDYVKANMAIIEQSVKVAQKDGSIVRECMAELGTELTPEQLLKFMQKLKETIEHIKSKHKENQ